VLLVLPFSGVDLASARTCNLGFPPCCQNIEEPQSCQCHGLRRGKSIADSLEEEHAVLVVESTTIHTHPKIPGA
jgi:hypothetical protein